MTAQPDQTSLDSNRIVISVDAMGGDNGPSAVVEGIAKSAEKHPDIGFILHGPEDRLKPLVDKRSVLADRVSYCDAPDVVLMEDKPSHVMRNGKGTSMWSALESVRNGDAQGAVSCGNTGALMALSMIHWLETPTAASNPRR